jgi:hypothetical protein
MDSARSVGIAEHYWRTGLAGFGGLQEQIRIRLIRITYKSRSRTVMPTGDSLHFCSSGRLVPVHGLL